MTDTTPETAAPETPGPEAGPAPALPVPPGEPHVRLHDVVATIDNFFARHPDLDRSLMTDLSSALLTVERLA